jgi:hypothetical protein
MDTRDDEASRQRADLLRERGRLNMLVTEAIVRMDHLYGRGPHPLPPQGRGIGLYVSRLEELIASLHSPFSYEGAVAEAGAVGAAIRGTDPVRAIRLSAKYLRPDDLVDVDTRAMAAVLWDALLTMNTVWERCDPPRGRRLLTW